MRQDVNDRYLAERVSTATPAELTGMVFDFAVRSLRMALVACEAADVPATSRHLLKAQDAVCELRFSLNPEAGETAEHLDAIYRFVYDRLVQANLRKDPAIIAEGIELLVPLQVAWNESCLGKSAPVGAAAS